MKYEIKIIIIIIIIYIHKESVCPKGSLIEIHKLTVQSMHFKAPRKSG
jgi:hypothetical protein